MTVADVRNMLYEFSNEKDLQSDVDRLFKLYGDKEFKILYDKELINAPSLSKFVERTNKNEKSIGIEPKGHRDNMPGYINIRYGTDHFHYQYIMMFRTGIDLSLIKKPYEQVRGYIYFLP
jgi:hypothetical protein